MPAYSQLLNSEIKWLRTFKHGRAKSDENFMRDRLQLCCLNRKKKKLSFKLEVAAILHECFSSRG